MTKPRKATVEPECDSWPSLIRWLIADAFKPITNQLEAIMSDLQSVKTTLESNNATIAELAGDIDEIKATNEELVMKVEELQSQQPNNQLVADIKKLAEDQAVSLRSAADKVPEPAPNPGEPA